MADILQNFPMRVPPNRAFDGVSQPALLDQWWTFRSNGQPAIGATCNELDFGPNYRWRAVVIQSRLGEEFELRMTDADRDWLDTVVRFEFSPTEAGTHVRFAHSGWPEANDHYRTSCHCWALYLRILRRYLEFGETVPYNARLSV